MFYVVLVLVLILIGAWDIGPFVDWMDDRNFHGYVKSGLMILVMGFVPAVIIGVAIIGDTMWGRGSR